MTFNIKNQEVVALINELATLTGESKTETIKKALQERKAKLSLQIVQPKEERLLRFLEHDVWSQIPQELLGKTISQAEQDDLLGFGPQGI